MVFGEQVLLAADPDNVDPDQRLIRFIAVVVTTGVCLLNLWSSSTSLRVNLLTAVLKILLLVGIIIAGGVYIALHAPVGSRSDWNTTNDKSPNWTLGILLVLFSYFGWDNATQVSDHSPLLRC